MSEKNITAAVDAVAEAQAAMRDLAGLTGDLLHANDQDGADTKPALAEITRAQKALTEARKHLGGATRKGKAS